MEIEGRNKRYSIIIAGILIFTVLSIFMIILLGVGNLKFYTLNNVFPINIDHQSNIDLGEKSRDSESQIFEPVAQGGWVDCLDTEQGYIKILDYYFDYPLPLHLSEEELDDWYVILEVRGGYDPLEGYIDIYQSKEGYKGRLWMDWTYLGLEPSWYEYWEVTFKPEGEIFLDSNQFPKVDHEWFFINKEGEIPGKDVEFDVRTLWTGCGEDNQNFEIILVQKFCFQSPLPPNRLLN
ncbi:MAG: hypothetical protein ACFFKA_09140 [Candidatus Thorarchaeota archaeon]